MAGRPTLFEDPQELADMIERYFKDCEPEVIYIDTDEGKVVATDKHGNTAYTNPKPPTTAGLAHYLGYASRQSLYDLKQRDEYSYIIKRAILYIESYHEGRLGTGERNTGSMFWLKNHNWSDKQEIETKNTHSFEHLSDEEIEEKLKKFGL